MSSPVVSGVRAIEPEQPKCQGSAVDRVGV